MPGLVLVTVVCALIIGPMMTSYSLAEYFTNPQFYRFYRNCLFILTGELPGVFTDNPSGAHVNVSLWSLRHEVLCYFIVLLAVLTGRFSLLLIAILAVGLPLIACPTITDFVAGHLEHIRATLSLGFDIPFLFRQGISVIPLFFVGSLFYYARDRIPMNFGGFLASIIVMIVIILFGEIYPLFPFALGYAIMYLAFSDNRFFKLFRTNDYSYGIYIFAFPIQQTMVTLFHGQMTWWQNALLSFPIVLGLAALSWHFVERPSLRYGRNLGKKVTQNPTARLGRPRDFRKQCRPSR